MQIHIYLWTVVLTVTVVLGGCATAEPTQKGLAIQARADAGDADAQYKMSLTYLHKYEGLRVSDEKRAEYLQKAVLQGHLEAKERLGSFYYMGRGVPKDYSKAAGLLLEVDREKFLSRSSCRLLANMYARGDGVPKNMEEAFKWYVRGKDAEGSGSTVSVKEISELARKYDFERKKYSLVGICTQGYDYETGYGVEKDISKAIKYYREGARQKQLSCQERLGYLYMNGIGVERDKRQAAMWYKIASLEYGGFSRIAPRESNPFSEDHVLTPVLRETVMMGARVGIANKAGEYDRERVAQLSKRIKAGNPVMVSHEYGIALNWYRCIRKAGLPKSCAGEIVNLFAIPVLGDVDCVICEPFMEEVDYIPFKSNKYGRNPYRRDFDVSD